MGFKVAVQRTIVRVWPLNWFIDQYRETGNILWTLAYSAPLIFLMVFIRARIADESIGAALLYGLAGIGCLTASHVVVEIWRRLSERRK